MSNTNGGPNYEGELTVNNKELPPPVTSASRFRSAESCGLRVALSVNVSVASCAPTDAGAKVTPSVQLALWASVIGIAPQVPLPCESSLTSNTVAHFGGVFGVQATLTTSTVAVSRSPNRRFLKRPTTDFVVLYDLA
jgi:hypothetical protein